MDIREIEVRLNGKKKLEKQLKLNKLLSKVEKERSNRLQTGEVPLTEFSKDLAFHGELGKVLKVNKQLSRSKQFRMNKSNWLTQVVRRSNGGKNMSHFRFYQLLSDLDNKLLEQKAKTNQPTPKPVTPKPTPKPVTPKPAPKQPPKPLSKWSKEEREKRGGGLRGWLSTPIGSTDKSRPKAPLFSRGTKIGAALGLAGLAALPYGAYRLVKGAGKAAIDALRYPFRPYERQYETEDLLKVYLTYLEESEDV